MNINGEISKYVSSLTPAEAEIVFITLVAESLGHQDRGIVLDDTDQSGAIRVALGDRLMKELSLDLPNLYLHMDERIASTRIELENGPDLKVADDGAWADTSDGRITDEQQMVDRWAEAVARIEVGRKLTRRLNLVKGCGMGLSNPVDMADAHALHRAVARRRGGSFREPVSGQYPRVRTAQVALERDIATGDPKSQGALSLMLWLTRLSNG